MKKKAAVIDKARIDAELLALQAARCQNSLKAFATAVWPLIEPVPFVDGWVVDAVCDHLEALTRGDIKKIVINIPPRHSKPLYTASMLLMADGSRKPLSEVQVGDYVITHRGRARQVTDIADQGLLPCVRITTDCGRSVIAALDHPFLTPDGWVQAGNLAPGMSLANVPTPEITPVQQPRPVEEFRLAGYFIGNGSTSHNGATITSADPENIADFLHCADVLGFIAEIKGYNTKSGVPVRAKRISFRGGVRPWLRAIGLSGKSSYTKRVPDFVFQGDNEHIAHFIAGYFMCDGTVNRKGNVRTDLFLDFTSVSRELLADVQHLCLRLGIQTRLVTRASKYLGEPYTSYRLSLTTQHELAKFKERIPIFGPKKERLDAWPTYKRRFNAVLSADPIISVADVGLHPCACITVDEDHTYTVNDLVCHNSTLISVIWRVWVWLQNPSERFLSASYSLNLSIRDNVRVRRIIEDPWFQARYGDLFQLASDQNVKSFFESDRQGYQMATSVNGSTTGNGGSILLLDDPHKADEAYSDVERESALMWFREVWTNRLNDQKRDKMIVVGQRIHENDVCGYILRERPDWVHLNLPATFEPSRRCFTPVVSTSSRPYAWKGADPRQEEGELLWPERFSKEALDGLKRDLGSSGFSAQYQQSPVPAGGGQFKELWFRYANITQDNYELETPEGVRHIPRKSCRLFMVIDLAISSKQDADYTVIQTWARTPDGEAILIDQVRGHFDNPEQFKLIYAVYSRYLPEFVQVETVAYQLALFQQLIARNVPCKEYRPVRDKVSRASTAAILFEQGRLYFLKDLLDLQDIKTELLRFPRYDHDDIVDAVSQAADYLTDPTNVNANQFVDDMNRRVQINRARELQPVQGFLPQTQQRLPQRAWWDQ